MASWGVDTNLREVVHRKEDDVAAEVAWTEEDPLGRVPDATILAKSNYQIPANRRNDVPRHVDTRRDYHRIPRFRVEEVA
jgi:hypothetical protein